MYERNFAGGLLGGRDFANAEWLLCLYGRLVDCSDWPRVDCAVDFSPDVIGLVGCREGAAESCVLQGSDIRSVRILIPGPRGMDQNFHDVTIVDMGDFHSGIVDTESAVATYGH